MSRWAPGTLVKTTVVQVTDYGAWTDLDGDRGLVLLPELSWGRVTCASDHVTEGQVITAVVLFTLPDKVRISVRDTRPDPWRCVAPGSIYAGRIASVTEYGLWLDLADEVEGLLLIDTLHAHPQFRTHPSDVGDVGDRLTVAVEDVNLAVLGKARAASFPSAALARRSGPSRRAVRREGARRSPKGARSLPLFGALG